MCETDGYGEHEYGNLVPLNGLKAENDPCVHSQTMVDPGCDTVVSPDTVVVLPGHFGGDLVNPDPSQTMVDLPPVPLIGSIYSNLLRPQFVDLVTHCTSPGDPLTMVCDIFAQLSICNVAAFDAICADSNEMEFRETIRDELKDLGRDLQNEEVFQFPRWIGDLPIRG